MKEEVLAAPQHHSLGFWRGVKPPERSLDLPYLVQPQFLPSAGRIHGTALLPSTPARQETAIRFCPAVKQCQKSNSVHPQEKGEKHGSVSQRSSLHIQARGAYAPLTC